MALKSSRQLLTNLFRTASGAAQQLQQQCSTSYAPQPAQLRRYVQGFARIAESEKGKSRFNGYYPGGYYINNVQVPGSVLAYTDMYMMWKPRTMSEVTRESLMFLEVITPAPEVVVFGCGVTPQPLPADVEQYLRSRNIMVEVLDSRNATGYFNVLNDDGRVVVGALLVLDAKEPMPEVLPQQKEPLWERGGLRQRD